MAGPGSAAQTALALVRPKRLLERDGELRVTLPVPSDVPAEELAPAVTQRARDLDLPPVVRCASGAPVVRQGDRIQPQATGRETA